jgi:hypothetical protein
MAYFELWPPRSDPKFSSIGPFPQPGAMSSSVLTPQLRLDVLESETVALIAQPNGVKLVVTPVNPAVAKIERIRDLNEAPNATMFNVMGLAQGVSLVEARLPGSTPASGMPAGVLGISGSLANLNVTVVDKNAITPSADFVAGFKEGFSASAGEAGKIVLDKISNNPVAFGQAVQLGCARGLLEGLVSLVKTLADILKLGLALSPVGMIVNTARYTFDPKFRDEVNKHVAEAKKLAETMAALVTEVTINKHQYVAIFNINGRMIGRIVGEEVGREIREEVTKKSVADIGEWVGFIIGRVMFEVIFIIGTEGIGMAANAAKVSGEGAGLAARLLPKLRRLLGPLRELEAFVKGRLGIKAVEALKPYVNLNPRALAEEVALGMWLDKMAQEGRLGEIGRVRGMPEGGGASPDFHFLPKGADPTDAAIAGRRADGVIAESSNIDNIISNAIGSKAGRQAEVIVIEIGSKGSSASVTDAAVKAWKVEHVAPMSPSLQRLMVVRNSGGARAIVLDMRIR